jgi:hypothetical protein
VERRGEPVTRRGVARGPRTGTPAVSGHAQRTQKIDRNAKTQKKTNAPYDVPSTSGGVINPTVKFCAAKEA